MKSNKQNENQFENLKQFAEENIAKWHIPGLAIGVLHQGEMNTAGFGITNTNHPLPVTDDTLFQIGSITKTYVGTAIMRLVEMDKLDLKATVQTYLPDFKVADETTSAQVTLLHLLTHTCGWIGDVFHDTGPGDDALTRYVADMASLEQLAPIGVAFSYNNAAFSVLGLIIEKITGKTFEAALQELVLDPLGLENSYLNPTDVMTHRFAVGHLTSDTGPQPASPWPIERSGNAQGGITCHIKDLLCYARFHLGKGKAKDGAQILLADSLALMRSPQTTIWENEYWGLSWSIKHVDAEWLIGHGGGTNGQICLLTFLPEHDFAIAVLTNSDQGSRACKAVTDKALKQYLSLETPEPEAIETADEDLATYTGCYSRPYCDLELGLLAGKLVGILTNKQGFPNEDAPPEPSPPPMTLAMCEKDRLLVMDGAYKGSKADIVRQPDGSIGWLRIAGRIHRRQDGRNKK